MSRSHAVDGIEPQTQRGSRFVKDRSSGRIHMMTTFLAAIGPATLNKVVLGDLLAVFAGNPLRITIIHQPVKASLVIGEICLKVLNKIMLHWEFTGIQVSELSGIWFGFRQDRQPRVGLTSVQSKQPRIQPYSRCEIEC